MKSSPLERLPTELTQSIFLYSGLNMAMAQASHCIGRHLSNEYMYNAVCDQYLTTNLDDRVEQSKAQTAIFASPWMTWTFFKKWIIRTYESKGCLCGLTPDEGCVDEQWPPNFEDATTMVFSRGHLPRLAFIHGRLPTKLLHKPWTEDKIQFLRFLLWLTSMTVDWKDPEVYRLVSEGRRQAFLDQNLEAVELFNHNRRLGKPPCLSAVRFAVTDAGCNRSIVYDTILSAYLWGLRGHSWQCSELDKWCENRIRVGDSKGQWLKTMLDECRRSLYRGATHWTYDGTQWRPEAPQAGGSSQNDCHHDPDFDIKAGDYEGGPTDTLVVHKLAWNKVSLGSFFAYIFRRELLFVFRHFLCCPIYIVIFPIIPDAIFSSQESVRLPYARCTGPPPGEYL
ncbi:hypothetical protein P153DRAFT_68590 [Dothidotthia symphoricarpi CBS 119687]|uniref:Uncharacterized protein n=1 Tax=Dothidotthia symphoricarpi CBS 119687 TaxID=1392245 RepID=A0A6A6A598_9PLEO|nr:uncharacterized protein P153DRAFT_68590 [Dothidotthia symphoricarpi CBS 119687]KAF2126716.1 hypothetical protein P153DRAFT_68590 [Dothidotthia symphoricarpi CBS 119687]